jgi:hypothetical protein
LGQRDEAAAPDGARLRGDHVVSFFTLVLYP